jgi:protein SCO1/2
MGAMVKRVTLVSRLLLMEARILAARLIQALLMGLLLSGSLLLSANSSIAAPLGADYFPNAILTNQDGKKLRFYDDVIKGKVVSINFMFTSCGDSCPLETAKLRQLQKLLGDHVGKNVYMYSISVDPERDSPAALKAYMKKYDVGPGWQFLTGKQEDVDLIRKKLGMLRDDETELGDHQTSFIFGNEATGQWLKRSPYDVPQSLKAVLLGRLQNHSLAVKEPRLDYSKVKYTTGASEGDDLFLTRCTACHTIGGGDKVGPDLLNVVKNRDRKWLIRWLKEPDVMLDEKEPLATELYLKYKQVPMPNLKLADDDIQHLIDYMEQESQRQIATNEKQTAAADKR